MNIIKYIKNKKYKNAEMVKYWQTQESVQAKVMLSKEGHYEMQMEGEKYKFPGYPRGSLLFGSLSPLKHWIKNKVFNDTWAELEKPSGLDWVKHQKTIVLDELYALYEKGKYDAVPYEHLNPAVKELWRAMTVIEEKTNSEKTRKIKEMMCFILNEDDAYRMRLQWIVKFFPKWWKPTIKHFDYGLSMLVHGEVIGDMKEKQKLLRRVLNYFLEDKNIRNYCELLLKEINWSKLKLTKADKYYFRAKYFKVDYPEYDY
jgi:hypothetical protein